MKSVLSIILFGCIAIVTQAQVVTWTGSAGNGFWDDGDNWDTSSPPGPSDQARIEIVGEKVFVQDGYSATIKELYCDGELTIEDGALLIIDNSDDNGLHGSGDLLVEGQLEISKSANNGLVITPFTVASSGILLISDSSNDGIQANGTNHGQLQITNTTNTAISGFITNNGELLIDDALNGVSGGLTNNGPAEIVNISNAGIVNQFDNTSTLDIDGGSLNMFLSFTSTNSGTINLDNAFVRSVTGPGIGQNLHNLTGGIINIDDTAKAMEFQDGALINDGHINITDADVGVEIESTTLTIGSTGSMDISTNTGSPLTLVDASSIDNSGAVTLASLAVVDMLKIPASAAYSSADGSSLTITNGDKAIDCKGAFVNGGVLLITGSQHGFHQGGATNIILENTMTGDIDMNQIVTNSIIADVDNEGDIRIFQGNATVAVEGHVDNSGEFIFSLVENGAISGSINNSGNLRLQSCGAAGLNLLEGPNVNTDLIRITNNAGTGLTLTGVDNTLSNSGNIEIEDLSFVSIAVSDQATFTNTETGYIKNQLRSNGLIVSNSASFVNLGNYEVINCTYNGVRVDDASFVNGIGAEFLTVYTFVGISAVGASTVVNEGDVYIYGSLTQEGVNVIANSTVTNKGPGTVLIEDAAVAGIVTDSGGSYLNEGNTTIHSDFTGITNNGLLDNFGMMEILSYSNLAIVNNNALSVMTNSGTLTIDKNGSPIDIKNVAGAMFSNTGVINVLP